MAVETLKSVAITNRDATPRVLNNPGIGAAARLKEVGSYLASVTASASVGSVIRMVDVPSNCFISELLVSSAAQGAGVFDIGVYRTTADGGAVVDADFFASAVDFAAAVGLTVDPVNLINESATYTLAKRQQRLWEALGMTSDPKSPLDIVLTCVTTAVTTGTGAVALRVRYVE